MHENEDHHHSICSNSSDLRSISSSAGALDTSRSGVSPCPRFRSWIGYACLEARPDGCAARAGEDHVQLRMAHRATVAPATCDGTEPDVRGNIERHLR